MLTRIVTEMVIGAAVLLLAVPCVAQAPETRRFAVALGTYDVLAGADLTSTAYLMGQTHGHFHEFIAPLGQRPATIIGSKLALAAGASYLLIRLHRTKPRTAFWLTVALSSVEASATAWNTHQLRRLR